MRPTASHTRPNSGWVSFSVLTRVVLKYSHPPQRACFDRNDHFQIVRCGLRNCLSPALRLSLFRSCTSVHVASRHRMMHCKAARGCMVCVSARRRCRLLGKRGFNFAILIRQLLCDSPCFQERLDHLRYVIPRGTRLGAAVSHAAYLPLTPHMEDSGVRAEYVALRSYVQRVAPGKISQV